MIDYKSLGLSEEDLKRIYKWMDLGRKVILNTVVIEPCR